VLAQIQRSGRHEVCSRRHEPDGSEARDYKAVSATVEELTENFQALQTTRQGKSAQAGSISANLRCDIGQIHRQMRWEKVGRKGA